VSSSLAVRPKPASNWARVLPRIASFPVALACMLLPLTVLTLRARFNDPDMWWHLKLGQIIWTTHHIPTVDLFSYTANHHAWIPHEWLSQLTIYAAYLVGGYDGLMLWLCVLSAALLISGYLLCSLYSGNAKVAFLGVLVIWLFATVGFAVRPQMIGYLLLVVEMIVLYLGRSRDPRWFWILPGLFALWVNCHGSFFVGMVIAMTLYALSFVGFRAGSLISVKWDSMPRRYLAWSLAISAVALFINPVGRSQIFYPVDTMLRQPLQKDQVLEWLPLQITDSREVILLALLLCILLLVLVRRSEMHLQELALVILGTWLAMRHQRMLFVFGILCAPVLCRMLSDLWENYEAEHVRPLLNAVFIVLSLFVAIWAFPGHRVLAQQVEAANPAKAVGFLKKNHVSGRMINDYVYGGYLIWAAPEYPVFVDGRGDVYEWTGVLPDYARWATLQEDPNALLDKYKVDFCLLSRNAPMAFVLPLARGWKIAYADPQAIIFVHSQDRPKP
jgi:hypothetical protein